MAFIVKGVIRCIEAPRGLKLRYGRRRRVEVASGGGVERFEFDLDGLGENPDFLALLRERSKRCTPSRRRWSRFSSS